MTGQLFYNSSIKTMTTDIISSYMGYNLSEGIFQCASTGYLSINGVCRDDPSLKFNDLFAALPACKISGTTTLPFYDDGKKECDVYFASFPNPTDNTTVNITYVFDGSRPVRFRSAGTGKSLPGFPPMHFDTTIDFHTFEPDSPLVEPNTKVPAVCLEPAPRCRADPAGVIQNITMYAAHPKNFTGQLWDQDVGDFDGDTTFVCLYAATPGPSSLDPDYNAVSKVVIELDTRYGAYSLCNNYPGVCFGSETFAVGREAALGVGSNGSQCDTSTKEIQDLGAWFSLPKSGMCAPGRSVSPSPVTPGPPGCSWRVVEVVKTVRLSCVVNDRGMKDACLTDKLKAPWSASKEVFAGVFASEDPAKGGCPAWN
jgi:hypothetical protein